MVQTNSYDKKDTTKEAGSIGQERSVKVGESRRRQTFNRNSLRWTSETKEYVMPPTDKLITIWKRKRIKIHNNRFVYNFHCKSTNMLSPWEMVRLLRESVSRRLYHIDIANPRNPQAFRTNPHNLNCSPFGFSINIPHLKSLQFFFRIKNKNFKKKEPLLLRNNRTTFTLVFKFCHIHLVPSRFTQTRPTVSTLEEKTMHKMDLSVVNFREIKW